MAGDKYDELFEDSKPIVNKSVSSDKYDALFDEPLKKKEPTDLESPSPDGTLRSATRSSNLEPEILPQDATVNPVGDAAVQTQALSQSGTEVKANLLVPPQLPKYRKPSLIKDVQQLDRDVTAKLIEQSTKEEDRQKIRQQAYDFLQAGKPAAAMAVTNILEQKFPTDPYVYQLKAHQAAVDGDKTAEIDNLSKAITHDKFNPDLYAQRALAASTKQDMGAMPEMDADEYLRLTEKAGTHDEKTAATRSQMYAIKGDQDKAKYWDYVRQGFATDRQKGVDSQNLIALSDWMANKVTLLGTPISAPAMGIVEGVKKVYEGIDPVNPTNTNLAKVASGVVSGVFGALMATPAGAAFNSAIAAGDLVGAGEVTQWAMAPVSKMLEKAGVDETKLDDWNKLGVEVLNFIPMMLFMGGYHKTAEKFAKREPFDAGDIRNLDEAVANATPEMVQSVAQNMDKFKQQREAAAEVSAIQKQSDVPTYRIDDKLYPKEEFTAEVKKRKKKGNKAIDAEVVGDPITEAKTEQITQGIPEELPPTSEITQPEITPEKVQEPVTNIRESLPDMQSNTRTDATRKILDYVAETMNVPKYDGDINTGSYISWLQDVGELGYNVSQLLNSPRKAFDLITEYKSKITPEPVREVSGESNTPNTISNEKAEEKGQGLLSPEQEGVPPVESAGGNTTQKPSDATAQQTIIGSNKDLKGNPIEDYMIPVERSNTPRVDDKVVVKGKNGNPDFNANFRGTVDGGKNAVVVREHGMQMSVPMEDVTLVGDGHVSKGDIESIKYAVEDGLFESDIADGKMSASDAKTIIESAGIEVPNGIKDMIEKSSDATAPNTSELSPIDKLYNFYVDDPANRDKYTDEFNAEFDKKAKKLSEIISKKEEIEQGRGNTGKNPAADKRKLNDLTTKYNTLSQELNKWSNDNAEKSKKPSDATAPKVPKNETDQNVTTSAPENLEKPVTPTEPVAPTVEQLQPSTTPLSQQIKSAAQSLRSLKVDKGLNDPKTMGISDVDLYNKAIDIAADIIETTGDFVKAIEDGMKVITNKSDRDEFKKAVESIRNVDVKTDQNDIVKTRHADTEILRDESGIGKYERNPQALEEINAEAQKKIQEGVNVNELITKVRDGGAVNPVEHMILRDYVLGLKEKVKSEPTPENFKLYEEALEANDLANSMSGRSLRSIQAEWNPEDSEIDMMIENKRLVGTDKLTPEQEAQNKKEFEEISALKQKYEEALKKAQEENAKLLAEKAIKEYRKNTQSGKKKTHDEYVAERTKIADSIKEKWNKSRLGTLNSMIIPVPYANQLYAIAPDVVALAKSYLSEGVSNLKEITSRIKEDTGITDISDRDIHDIISGKYNAEKKSRSELSVKLQNLKKEAKEINTLEDLINKKEPTSESGKIKRNKEKSDVRKRIDEIRKEQGLGKWSDESKLQTRKSQMLAEIKRIEEELKSTKPINTSPKEPIKLDKEGIEIQNQLIAARQRRKARIIQEKYEARSFWQKAAKFSIDLFNGATRGAMATADVSMALLQNGVMAFTHPVYWGKAFKNALADMVNEKKFSRWMADQEADPRFHVAKEAGLSVTDPKDPSLVAAEELFQSNLLDKIPFLGKPLNIKGKNYGGITQASSRVFASMSNRIRINMFYDLVEQWETQGKTIHNSPELYKATARLLNASTGRAKFGKQLEADARIISNLLWSPRMYASQLELLTAVGNPYYWKAPKEVKMQIAKDISKYVGVSLSLIAIAKLAGAEVEDDPRSKDFGKIKIGNTRIGMPGGLTQWIVLARQLQAGQTKSTVTGEIKDLGPGFADQSRWDVFARFLRGKLSPTLSLGYDLMDGRTYMGEDIGTLDHVIQYTTPMSIRGMVETSKNEGIPTGIWTGAVASTGLPIQTYSPTGVYPTKDFGKGKESFNALGEDLKNYDQQVWKFAKDNKIDLTPPNKSSITYRDNDTGKRVEFDNQQYSDFVKYRGEIVKQGIQDIMEASITDRNEYIERMMKNTYADGTPIFKDATVAGIVFDKVIIPQAVESVKKKANAESRFKVMGYKDASKTDQKIMDIIREYNDKMTGK